MPPKLVRVLRYATRDPEWALQTLRVGRLLRRQPAEGKLFRLPPDGAIRQTGSLTDPPVVPASEAHHLRETDVVLGVYHEGEARAYPWRQLQTPHVANDVVGGRPVATILCGVCSSGVAVDPIVDGRRLTFDPTHIYNGNIAVEDAATRSVWAPLIGRAIRGEHRGRALPILPVWQMEWHRWRARHPNTMVLSPGIPDAQQPKSIGEPWLAQMAIFRRSLARWDERLPPNALVVGAVVPPGAKVYPLDRVAAAGGVVNDEVRGQPVVVLGDGPDDRYGAAVFSRAVNGRTLTFKPASGGPVDEETGTRWTTYGRGREGPLAGHELRFVPSYVSQWYAWPAAFELLELWS